MFICLKTATIKTLKHHFNHISWPQESQLEVQNPLAGKHRIEWAGYFSCSSTHKMKKSSVLLLHHPPLNTSSSFSFAPFAVRRVQWRLICQKVESWRQAQWWWALQGPCSAWLGSLLCWEYGRLREICLSEAHWWEMCSAAPLMRTQVVHCYFCWRFLYFITGQSAASRQRGEQGLRHVPCGQRVTGEQWAHTICIVHPVMLTNTVVKGSVTTTNVVSIVHLVR